MGFRKMAGSYPLRNVFPPLPIRLHRHPRGFELHPIARLVPSCRLISRASKRCRRRRQRPKFWGGEHAKFSTGCQKPSFPSIAFMLKKRWRQSVPSASRHNVEPNPCRWLHGSEEAAQPRLAASWRLWVQRWPSFSPRASHALVRGTSARFRTLCTTLMCTPNVHCLAAPAAQLILRRLASGPHVRPGAEKRKAAAPVPRNRRPL